MAEQLSLLLRDQSLSCEGPSSSVLSCKTPPPSRGSLVLGEVLLPAVLPPCLERCLLILLQLTLLFKDFVYLFLDRGEGREKERERNINVWLPLT